MEKVQTMIISFINHYLVKLAALSLLLFSVYNWGAGTEQKILFSIIGFASLTLVIGGLFAGDLTNLDARNTSDKNLFNSILDTIPFDQDFVYWFDKHNFGTETYSSVYLEKFFTFFIQINLDKSKFFHKQELQDEFDQFIASLSKFKKYHDKYTVVSGDKVQGVERKDENYASDPTWYQRVANLNNSAADVFNKYESFTIAGKKLLLI